MRDRRQRSRPAVRPASPRAAALARGLVVALTALVSLPALGNDFVNWDDDDYVYLNGRVREHSLSVLATYFVDRDPTGHILLPNVQGNYHPLTMLSLGLDALLSTTDAPKAPDRETDLHANVFH